MAKVAILIPSLKKGGAEKQACILAKVLAIKHDVSIIVPFPESGMEKENIDLSSLSNKEIVCFPNNKSGSVIQLYKVLKQLHPDYLFCYLTWPDFWGVLIGRLVGIKCIYQGLRNAKIPRVKMILERVGNFFATGAVTNNYAGEKVFGKYGIKRQVVISNCYLNPKLPIIRNYKDAVTVITVGRFVEQKDYSTLISSMKLAIAQNPNLRLKIIGHGELENSVRLMVKNAGIASVTEILINPPDIMEHLIQSDIYLSTSLFEGTSNSIMEALDASLPVVATRVGDNEKLVLDGVNGFLTDTKDFKSLSDKIVMLGESLEMRNKMGIRGNEILREEFGVEKFSKCYDSLLR